MTAGTVKANSKPWMRLSAFPGLFRCGQIAQWLLFITFMDIAFVLLLYNTTHELKKDQYEMEFILF